MKWTRSIARSAGTPNAGSQITSPEIREALRCRACGGADLIPYLDLGTQALANAFRPLDQVAEPEFTAPLGMQWCPECGLSQLTHIVSPERLYTHYLYASGANPAWAAHQQALVEAVSALRPHPSFVVEIASNDGTLLERFQAAGHGVLGVEPAKNLVDATKVPTVNRFWSPAVAEGILQFHEPADVVIAQNVFGHVDDAKAFLDGVAMLLAPDGVCLIECPHILPLLDQSAVDTIYHEHLSVWSLRALQYVAVAAGLSVTHVESFPELHGGSVRYYLEVGDHPLSSAGQELLQREEDLFARGIKPYQQLAREADRLFRHLRDYLEEATDMGKHVAGYGASAKGNVLLQAAGVSVDQVPVIYDDSPLKVGLLSPGVHALVAPLPSDWAGVDVLLLLAWNWADGMQQRAREQGYRGQFVIPVPSVRLLT